MIGLQNKKDASIILRADCAFAGETVPVFLVRMIEELEEVCYNIFTGQGGVILRLCSAGIFTGGLGKIQRKRLPGKKQRSIMKQYRRISLPVTAAKYEIGKGMEDGFRLYSQVITNDGIALDGLIKIEREDGVIVCPFVRNRRGVVFIREGDYIICEDGGEKHVCGEDKFGQRFEEIRE